MKLLIYGLDISRKNTLRIPIAEDETISRVEDTAKKYTITSKGGRTVKMVISFISTLGVTVFSFYRASNYYKMYEYYHSLLERRGYLTFWEKIDNGYINNSLLVLCVGAISYLLTTSPVKFIKYTGYACLFGLITEVEQFYFLKDSKYTGDPIDLIIFAASFIFAYLVSPYLWDSKHELPRTRRKIYILKSAFSGETQRIRSLLRLIGLKKCVTVAI